MDTMDLSDEFIWSLDSFLQEDAAVEIDSDGELARASVLSQEIDPFLYSGGAAAGRASSAAMIENDLVYGRGSERHHHPHHHEPLRVSLAGAAPIREDDEREEEEEEIIELHPATWVDPMMPPFHMESVTKSSQPSGSDETDRSFSVASEQSCESPPESPLFGISSFQASPTIPSFESSYEQRIEATLTESMGKLRRLESGDAAGTDEQRDAMEQQLQSFTMSNIGHFDAHFGRALYLEQLGRSFVDGSSSKSLASYRMSSYHRISTASDIIKQGWLVKKGEVVPSWHRRWFTLRRMPEGPMLTYARDDSPSAPAKMIELSSTSRCVVRPKLSRDHEFRVITSTDSSRREFALAAVSNFELTEWVCTIQSAINAGNKSTFEGSEDFQRIWNNAGIDGFLLRYGIRKCSSRNHLQTRVLELNFAEQTIINSRRSESLTTLYFNDLREVSVSTARPNNEEHGIVLDFNGRHRSWPIYLDTKEARDDLLGILEKIAAKNVNGEDLELRSSRLILKTGFMERKNIGTDKRLVGLHATLKGRLFVCLYENCLVVYPEHGDMTARPWYVVTLKGIHVTCKEEKSMLVLGRLTMVCASPEDTRAWYNAILSAMMLPPEIIELELKERVKIRNAFHVSVSRLRKLLKAKVKPEVNGPPKDQKAIELMMRVLWDLTFPDSRTNGVFLLIQCTGEAYTSNSDPRWLELGFQRGGPASDLRSSGLLGLYSLIYFVNDPSSEFQRILERTRHGVSEGNMKNYPLAIACINISSVLVETLGFGDAGTHSAGCSLNAMKTFVHLIAQTVAHAPYDRERAASVSTRALSSYASWDDIVGEADNHVFEDIFCLLFPILDLLFVEMDAGYMEFGQVVAAFRRRINVIFDQLPKTMSELAELAAEPCTDKLLLILMAFMGATSAIAAVVALLASLYIHVLNDFAPLDIYAPPQTTNASVESLFSDSYYHARALFRAQAHAADVALYTLPLDDHDHLDLTIDVAVLEGAKDRVVVHVSGTHGVEGFAGSAIQSALLGRLKRDAGGKKDEKRPTVILVHALNAYGFSQLRRFNEHNVDINRNWLSSDEFAKLVAADPNAYGYADLYDLFNPSSIETAHDSFWLKTIYYLSRKGSAAIKRAVVSGNYRFPQSIFYGGNELQPSLRLLQQFLKEHVDLEGVRAFGFIDVHTGLGPPGFDTLMVESSSDVDKVRNVFGEFERSTNRIQAFRGNGDGATSGYDGSHGVVMDGVATLLPSASKNNNVLILQEFGTVPGPFVLKAVAEENFVYHNARGQRLPYAEKLRDVFYLHRSFMWKKDVLERGLSVFDQIYAHVANDFAPLDIYAPSETANASIEALFSDSYYHARALFRAKAETADLPLYTLPLDEFKHLDLTIDIAVVEGAKDRVLLHISGTHGVEGFAGSAIQSALLGQHLDKKKEARKSSNGEAPTVIFVHALNPYGFSQLRRFNEHNVDLNRNWLTPEQFEELAKNDPNKYGYMDVDDVLNPTSISGVMNSFWMKAVYYLSTKGFASIKRALVSGTYHFPKSVYYGGNELQPSLVLLEQFLKQHVDLGKVHAFGMVDVHTGLGPSGFDTLLIGSAADMNTVNNVFGTYEKSVNNITPLSSDGNDVSEGYDATVGFTLDGIASLLPAQSKQRNVLLAQEFGTVPGVFIAKATVEENFAYQHAPSRRLLYAEKLRDVFYLHRSASWKASVVGRGIAVYDQVYAHIATCA
ncbi:Engulfment and cell motility elm family protein, partial [Globisporangium splendens]